MSISFIVKSIIPERKWSVFSSDSKAVLAHGKTISTETEALSAQLEDFAQTSTLHARKLRNEADQFRRKEFESLT
jgi:kinesin family protein 11